MSRVVVPAALRILRQKTRFRAATRPFSRTLPDRARPIASHAISAKDPTTPGNPFRTVHRLTIVVVIAAAQTAHADACPPAVALSGDEAVVAEVRVLLGERGI